MGRNKNKLKILVICLLSIIFFEIIILNQAEKSLNLERSKELCIQKFSNAFQRQKCLDPYFQKLTQLYSPGEAMNAAIALQKQGVINQCHLAAHTIGHATLVKNNFNIAKSLISCPQSCLEGCQHGVVEDLMSKIKNSQQLLNTIPHICDGISNQVQHFQCIHGIGHGLRRHGEIDLNTAITACNGFSEDSSINSCLDGVFMENMNLYLELSEQDLLAMLPTMCLDIEKQFGKRSLYYCVRNVAEGLMFYTGGDVDKAKGFCNLLSSGFIKQCQISIDREKILDVQQ